MKMPERRIQEPTCACAACRYLTSKMNRGAQRVADLVSQRDGHQEATRLAVKDYRETLAVMQVHTPALVDQIDHDLPDWLRKIVD